MANQNLSQFGEKLFVADADHTFIWDSEASISKRVSRNSWLNSGTLTSDAPVTISQTWGNNLVAFTALKVNAAGTSDANSATASNFLELQVNGATRFKIDKLAHLYIANPNSRFDININNVPVAAFFAGGLMRTYGSLGFSDPTTFPNDLILTRDGAGQLALRNGAAAQTFNVYNTYSNAGADYERGTFDWKGTANVLRIGTEKLGAGQARAVDIISTGQIFLTSGPGSSIDFRPAGITRWNIHTPGNLWATTHNAYDIGASGANSPRNIYAGTSVNAAGIIIANNQVYRDLSSVISFPSNGVIRLSNYLATDFSLLQLGGGTNLFPAIKRNGAGLDIVLANDSGFAAVQDLYRRFGAGTPEGVVTAPIGAVYHNTTGGAGTSFYVKESGTGNTGWVGK